MSIAAYSLMKRGAGEPAVREWSGVGSIFSSFLARSANKQAKLELKFIDKPNIMFLLISIKLNQTNNSKVIDLILVRLFLSFHEPSLNIRIEIELNSK